MLRPLKPILKSLITKKQRLLIRGYRAQYGKTKSIKKTLHFKVFVDMQPESLNSALLYKKMFRKIRPLYKNGFVYPFDPNVKRIPNSKIAGLASITPDYSLIIHSDLRCLLNQVKKVSNTLFAEREELIIDEIDNLAVRIATEIEEFSILPELLHRDAKTLHEAIQKILFYHGLMYQSGHIHNGLGRLDMILYPYYKKDVDNNVITRDDAKQMLRDMAFVLNTHTKEKSPELIGDTGQYILLGGIDKEDNTVDNDLTRMFLDVYSTLNVPDPKLILRVNSNTSDEVWELALKCIASGCGSPLLMNEDSIMHSMIEFGYDKADVWNVGTSACWEPLIIGKSSDQNNPFHSIRACDALNVVLFNNKEYAEFSQIVEDVKKSLGSLTRNVIVDRDYDYSPLMSLFTPDCIAKGKDFSHGGTKYMHQGAQLLGLPNLVNSLMNIKEYVFDKKIINLNDCREIIRNNFSTRPDLKTLFTNANEKKFGSTDKDVLNLTNELIASVSATVKTTTANGNSVKFGLSSPSYLGVGKETSATLDGRKAGEPLAVHISPVSSKIDISQILRFGASLRYPSNCLNGNVVDFIIPSSYRKNMSKLKDLLKDSIKNGLFELQLNVLDKATLIDAKAHPEKYPNLIVRVWGFSAYFNDLPEAYKDNLIARAETYVA